MLEEESNKLHTEIQTCEKITKEKLPELKMKNVKTDFKIKNKKEIEI